MNFRKKSADLAALIALILSAFAPAYAVPDRSSSARDTVTVSAPGAKPGKADDKAAESSGDDASGDKSFSSGAKVSESRKSETEAAGTGKTSSDSVAKTSKPNLDSSAPTSEENHGFDKANSPNAGGKNPKTPTAASKAASDADKSSAGGKPVKNKGKNAPGVKVKSSGKTGGSVLSESSAKTENAPADSRSEASTKPAGDKSEHAFGSEKGGSESSSRVSATARREADDLLMHAMSLLGVVYRFGGSSPAGGLDCSGFVQYIFKNALGINLPRTSAAQFETGTPIAKEDLRPGDLVFFVRGKRKRIGHVGMYIGNNKFIHAPRTGKDIEIQNLDKPYYVRTYAGARRYTDGGAGRFLRP